MEMPKGSWRSDRLRAFKNRICALTQNDGNFLLVSTPWGNYFLLRCGKTNSYSPVSCGHESSDILEGMLDAGAACSWRRDRRATTNHSLIVTRGFTSVRSGESVLRGLPRPRNQEGEP